MHSIFRPHLVLPLLCVLVAGCTARAHPDRQVAWSDEYAADMRLWYEQPAEEWVEALPVGNGRIGAMVFGRTDRERIQLNEESVWAGRRHDDDNPGALENLEEIRQLIFAGRHAEAYDLATEHLVATPPAIRSYQTLMDLWLDLSGRETTKYARDLDLGSGIARTSYVVDGVRHTREVFASAVDDVIVVRLETDAGGAISTGISLSRPQDATVEAIGDAGLLLSGRIDFPADETRGPGGEGVRFAGGLRAITEGGTVRAAGDSLLVEDADALTILITGATDYNLEQLDVDRSKDPEAETTALLNAAGRLTYGQLRERHVADHAPLMARVTLDLTPAAVDALPTDIRLQRVQEGAVDPHLSELYFQYGRYLLLGSSRAPGVLPANLQGIWNEHLEAPWQSDYHVNINLQMNYWPAEVTNLPETVAPLVGFMDALREPGGVTAREMYGADGWAMHSNTDIFGRTGLHDEIRWGTFPLGGAWMTFPIWRHYAYNRDIEYLREKAYPILKGSAEFVLDFLVEGPDGYLVTTPSYSPENAFVAPETGEAMQLTYAPTMDIQIIRELFHNTIVAAEMLGIDADFRDSLRATLDRLPPVRIGDDGTIMEWVEDYEEAEPGHRHISHLLGLHPGSTITTATPELFDAARATIDRRLEHGGGHTGWSRAWIVNFFARLHDAEWAHENLIELYRHSTLPNMFDSHPPFQIDGNFGGTAGIAEMLLQSHAGYIDLLPALPDAWPSGRVNGLRAMGGYAVGITWEGGSMTEATVAADHDGRLEIRAPLPVEVYRDGAMVEVRREESGRLSFEASAGATFTLRPAS